MHKCIMYTVALQSFFQIGHFPLKGILMPLPKISIKIIHFFAASIIAIFSTFKLSVLLKVTRTEVIFAADKRNVQSTAGLV